MTSKEMHEAIERALVEWEKNHTVGLNILLGAELGHFVDWAIRRSPISGMWSITARSGAATCYVPLVEKRTLLVVAPPMEPDTSGLTMWDMVRQDDLFGS